MALLSRVVTLGLVGVMSVTVLPLLGCSDSGSEQVPSIVQAFVDNRPELKLELVGVEAAPDWVEGKRWRAHLPSGKTLVFYEQDGRIVSLWEVGDSRNIVWQEAGYEAPEAIVESGKKVEAEFRTMRS